MVINQVLLTQCYCHGDIVSVTYPVSFFMVTNQPIGCYITVINHVVLTDCYCQGDKQYVTAHSEMGERWYWLCVLHTWGGGRGEG